MPRVKQRSCYTSLKALYLASVMSQRRRQLLVEKRIFCLAHARDVPTVNRTRVSPGASKSLIPIKGRKPAPVYPKPVTSKEDRAGQVVLSRRGKRWAYCGILNVGAETYKQ